MKAELAWLIGAPLAVLLLGIAVDKYLKWRNPPGPGEL